jgi:sugar phosphate isomerase/epimerase
MSMRIGISNLAWEPPLDRAVAQRLQARRIDAIDIAPGRYFPDPTRTNAADIKAVRDFWASQGVTIVGLQALLFGTHGLNLFGKPAVRTAMLDHLAAVFRIGQGLGARVAVFGSPKQRDRSGIDEARARDLAVEFFREAGDRAARAGLTLCLEPNPPRYGANFMTTAGATADVVRAVAHPAVRLQCDLGAMHVGGESLADGLDDWQSLVAHVHLSEPDLLPLGTAGTPHAAWAPSLRERLPNAVACIEMLPPAAPDPVAVIDAALALACAHYGEGAPE